MNIKYYLLLLFLMLSNLFCISSTLQINEIYKKTQNSYHYNQWIEIFNNSQKDINAAFYNLKTFSAVTGKTYTANIKCWAEEGSTNLNQALNRNDLIINSSIIPPLSYAVILDQGYMKPDKLSEMEVFDFPQRTIILTTDQSQIAGASITSNILLLYSNQIIDTFGGVVDTCWPINFGEIAGISIEKIFKNQRDVISNWGYSINTGGNTIGTENSLSINYSQLQTAEKIILKIYQIPSSEQRNIAGIPVLLEFLALNNNNKIDYSFNQSVQIKYSQDVIHNKTSLLKNKHIAAKELSFTMTQGRSNPFYLISLYPFKINIQIKNEILGEFLQSINFSSFNSPHAGKIFISEIMADTKNAVINSRSFTKNDYFEIYNNSETTLTMSQWSFQYWSDNFNNDNYMIPTFTLPMNSALCVVQNIECFRQVYKNAFDHNPYLNYVEAFTGYFGFSKTATIILKDENKKIVDILKCTSSWQEEITRSEIINGQYKNVCHTKFVSLERINFIASSFDKDLWANSKFFLGNINYIDDRAEPYTISMLCSPGLNNSYNNLYKESLYIKIKKLNYIYKNDSLNFYILVNKSCYLDLKIYSKEGIYLGTYLKNYPGYVNEQNVIPFFGQVNKKELKTGFYFLVASALSEKSGETSQDKTFFAVIK